MPRPARRPSRAEQGRHRVDRARGPRHELRHREALHVLPQELHVPRHGEELPNHAGARGVLHARPSRPRRRRPGGEGAHRHRGPWRRRHLRERHRDRHRLHGARGHHAHPYGGRRGQDDPHRRRRGPYRGRHAFPCRLQPRGHAAHRARHRTRPAHARGSAPVHAEAAPDLPRHRHLRLLDGGRLHALRRQRQPTPARVDQARRENRAQEHELLQKPPRRLGLRNLPSGGGARGGRADLPGNAPLGPNDEAHHRHAREGDRRRLPPVPRARFGALRSHRRVHRGRPRQAARASRPEG